MNEQHIRQAITPLRMIFWGGLLCIFDFAFNFQTDGRGFRFDILNDALGAILIMLGVFKLRTIPVHSRYAGVMRFPEVVSVLAVLDAIREHLITPLPALVHLVLNLFNLVSLFAIVAFCVAMRWFCEETRLTEASRSWKVTTLLFVIIYLLPFGLVYLATGISIAMGASFKLNLGPAGILLLPVFAIPLFHLFVSTSRMKREVEGAASSNPEDWMRERFDR